MKKLEALVRSPYESSWYLGEGNFRAFVEELVQWLENYLGVLLSETDCLLLVDSFLTFFASNRLENFSENEKAPLLGLWFELAVVHAVVIIE